MKNFAAFFAVVLLSLTACRSTPDYGRALPFGAPALLPLGPNDPVPEFQDEWEARAEIAPALENSLAWMAKPSSKRFFPIEGITFERAQKSLERFRALLTESRSSTEFAQRMQAEFQIYKSAGWNGKGGGVLFTGYCTPILEGRLEPDDTYRYPLYALPDDLQKGPEGEILGQRTAGGLQPYPTRRAIEASGMLSGKGLELAYLKDPLDAFIAHVNGSAFIDVGAGELYKLGYSGKNGRPYTSLGQELVKDKQLKADQVSLAAIRSWAAKNPGKVDEYLQRNESYVFFTPIGTTPHGSLNVPVTGGRSLATDKRLFPRGAIVYVEQKPNAKLHYGAELAQFMFDQDTGGAIRTAGRADAYLGVGPEAEQVAGATRREGQLYYFFLKE
jgi:membrane-bound lytic murein transglycosylase A